MAGIESTVTDLRERLRKAELKEVEVRTKLEAAQTRYEEAIKECDVHGISPDELPATIIKVEKQMETLINSIEELLPRG